MSALWDRSPGYHTHTTTVAQNMELRTVPPIFTVPAPEAGAGGVGDWDARGVLTNVYGNSLTSWLYGVRMFLFLHGDLLSFRLS